MLAQRLLSSSGGSGGFATYPSPAALDLSEVSFWNDLGEPRAVYANGKTHLGWITDAGAIKVATYTHATGTLSSPFTLKSGLSASDGNIHLSVSLCVRASDSRLVAAYSAQGTRPFVRISTNPEDTSAWGSESTFLDAGVVYTYGALYQVTDGTLYYITRRYEAPTFFIVYGTSTDGGATWSASATKLLQPASTAATYWRTIVDGAKLHIFTTDTDRDPSTPSSVYHLYLEGTTLKKSDGTTISGPYPVASSAGTLVHDDADGSAFSLGGAIHDGRPATLLAIHDGTENLYRVARWTGSAWQVDDVAESDGIVGTNEFVIAGAIEKADADVVWLPRKVAGTFELYRYRSTDDGATWAGVAVTSGSGSDNLMPDTVFGSVTALRVVWGRGTYTSDSNFDFTLWGASG